MTAGRRLLALGASGALALSGVLVSASPSGAQTRAVTSGVRVTSSAPVRIAGDGPAQMPRGAVRLGPLAPGTKIHLDVTLQGP